MYLVEITKANRNDDLHVEFTVQTEAFIYVAQNAFGPDGYRVFEYEPFERLDGFTLPEVEGAHYGLRTHGEELDGEATYTDKAELLAARDALNASDGYEIFAAWPGDGGSPMLETRPCLWQRAASTIAKRQNEHGRADQDRF